MGILVTNIMISYTMLGLPKGRVERRLYEAPHPDLISVQAEETEALSRPQ